MDIIEPLESATLYDGLRIDSTPISLTVLVPALAILYGSAFQVGYFIHVGVEFLPHMSVWDIMFPIAALLPFCFIWLPIVSAVKHFVESRVAEGTFAYSRLGMFTFGYLKYELLAIWLLFLIAIFTGVNLLEAVRWLAPFVCLVCARCTLHGLSMTLSFMAGFQLQHACGFASTQACSLWEPGEFTPTIWPARDAGSRRLATPIGTPRISGRSATTIS